MGTLYRRFWAPVMLADELGGPDSPPGARQRAGRKPRRVPRHRTANSDCSKRTARTAARTCSGAATKRADCAASITAGSSTSTASARICRTAPKVRRSKRKCARRRIRRSNAAASSGPTWARPTRSRRFRKPKSSTRRRRTATSSRSKLRGNFAQMQEGDVDSSHVSFLHSSVGSIGLPGSRVNPNTFVDKSPRWFTMDMDYGMMLSAQRNAGPDTFQWRVNQWLMPFCTLIAGAARHSDARTTARARSTTSTRSSSA